MSMYPKGRPGARPLPPLPESRITSPRNVEPRGDQRIQRAISSTPLNVEDRVFINVLAGPDDVFLQATVGTDTQLTIFGDGEVLFGGDIDELRHIGLKAGFYNTEPIVKQTGVAVTAAGIHAALVNLGLISA